MPKRKSISKRVRFSVFARDGFTCAYCGETPPNVKLVVDHIIPVIEGGSDSEDNLRTSCESCNQGKGRKPLPDGTGPDMAALARAQENMELIDLATASSGALKAAMELRQNLVNYVCEVCCTKSINKSTATSLINLAREFGVDEVFRFIDISAGVTCQYGYKDTHFIKYVCGIAKHTRGKSESVNE